jgi:subtilisin family serine protease
MIRSQKRQTNKYLGFLLAFIGLFYASSALAITSPGGSSDKSEDVAYGFLARSTLQLRSELGTWCSASLIGPRAIVTSAACFSGPSELSGEATAYIGSRYIHFRCARSRLPDLTFQGDVALCIADSDLAGLNPIPVDLNYVPSKSNELAISGYGCVTPSGVDRDSGTVHFGVGKITDAPGERGAGNNYFLISGARACFGDAGGGVFVANASSAQGGSLIGVIVATDTEGHTYVTWLGSSALRVWITSWASSTDAAICGVAGDQTHCASSVDAQRQTTPVDQCSVDTASLHCVSSQFAAALAKSTLIFGKEISVRFAESQTQIAQDLGLSSVPLQGNSAHVQTLPGEKITDTFRRACGMSADQGETSAESILQETHPELDFKKVFEHQEAVDLPPCPVLTPNTAGAAQAQTAGEPLPIPPTSSPPGNAILTLTDVESAGKCTPSLSNFGSPYDIGMLLDVLALNHSLAAIQPDRVVIMIADSGLKGPENSMFSRRILVRPEDQDWVAYDANVAPLATNERVRNHGTEVAALALGGPVFARMLALSSDSARISLDIKDIYKTPTSPQAADEAVNVDINLFGDPVSEARDRQAILNLSLRSTGSISAIESDLENAKSPILYVVAAGNEGKEIGLHPGIGIDTIYPALYGGQESSGRDRVLTVTAVDGTGKVAEFANFGSSYVDIGAPGCMIPTVVYDEKASRFTESIQSGTSLSAPMVSFVAGLLRSEGHLWSPVQIKRRILMSADLDETQANKIRDGRKLNVVKAVAILKDVIEESASGRLLIGDVDFLSPNDSPLGSEDSLPFKCDGQANRYISKKDLFKMSQWQKQADVQKIKVYFRGASPLFDEDTCTVPEGIKLRIIDFQAKKPVTYSLSELKDVVMRSSQ